MAQIALFIMLFIVSWRDD